MPKNVVNNNILRAYLVDCAGLKLVQNPCARKKSANVVFGWVLAGHRKQLEDFVGVHQDTCAIYELVLTMMLTEVLWFCVFTCPRCGKQQKVQVGG